MLVKNRHSACCRAGKRYEGTDDSPAGSVRTVESVDTAGSAKRVKDSRDRARPVRPKNCSTIWSGALCSRLDAPPGWPVHAVVSVGIRLTPITVWSDPRDNDLALRAQGMTPGSSGDQRCSGVNQPSAVHSHSPARSSLFVGQFVDFGHESDSLPLMTVTADVTVTGLTTPQNVRTVQRYDFLFPTGRQLVSTALHVGQRCASLMAR